MMLAFYFFSGRDPEAHKTEIYKKSNLNYRIVCLVLHKNYICGFIHSDTRRMLIWSHGYKMLRFFRCECLLLNANDRANVDMFGLR